MVLLPPKELGQGTYRAQQIPGAVVLFAEGWHPTAGYHTWLEKNPVRVFPPEFTLYQIPPDGPVTQQLTPFVVWVMFPAPEPVEKVRVHDADGPHDVPVEQTPDIKPSCLHVPIIGQDSRVMGDRTGWSDNG